MKRRLLILLLLAAVPVGVALWYIGGALRQQSIISDLEARGAYVSTDPVGPQWLQSIFGERFFSRVTYVSGGADFKRSRAAFQRLAQLKDVQFIQFSEQSIADEDLEPLSTLPLLESLELPDTRITSQGVRFLDGKQSLKHIELNRSEVDDIAIAALSHLPNLEHLELDGTPVTESGAEKLVRALPKTSIYWAPSSAAHRAAAKALARVGGTVGTASTDIESTPLGYRLVGRHHVGYVLFCHPYWQGTSEDFKEVANLDFVVAVAVNGKWFTDSDFATLNALPDLEIVSFENVSASDVGFLKLRENRRLKSITVRKRELTSEVETELRHSFPNAEIKLNYYSGE